MLNMSKSKAEYDVKQCCLINWNVDKPQNLQMFANISAKYPHLTATAFSMLPKDVQEMVLPKPPAPANHIVFVEGEDYPKRVVTTSNLSDQDLNQLRLKHAALVQKFTKAQQNCLEANKADPFGAYTYGVDGFLRGLCHSAKEIIGEADYVAVFGPYVHRKCLNEAGIPFIMEKS